MKTIIDLHTHPSLKPYNNQGYRPDEKLNIWKSVEEKNFHFQQLPGLIRKVIRESARSSQSNLDKLIDGNVRGVFFTIHPVERGWYSLSPRKGRRSFRRFLLDLILRKKHYPHLGASMSGLPYNKVDKIIKRVNRNEGINYFEEETFPEYDYIRKQSETISISKKKFRLANDYSEFKNILLNQHDTIAGILTIEGGHALGNVKNNEILYKTYKDLDSDDKEMIKKHYISNVSRLKGHADISSAVFHPQHTPFFITFCHMFNNYLAGHAKTFTPGKFILPGMDNLLDQEIGLNAGFSQLGREVVDLLLSRENGRRILIDVKHLSRPARKEYFDIVKQKRRNGDHIPVIFSHGAVSGYDSSYFENRGRQDTEADHTLGYFSHMSINLYNDEIREIVESDGLIGLATHEGRMPGGKAKKELEEIKRKISWQDHRADRFKIELRNAYLKLFLGNVFQIVHAVNDEKAWDHICIGSDYDGIMDPFDRYPECGYFSILLGDIQYYLKHFSFDIDIYEDGYQKSLDKKELKKLMFGLDARMIVEKIAYKNIENFLSKYFTDEYRVVESDMPVASAKK